MPGPHHSWHVLLAAAAHHTNTYTHRHRHTHTHTHTALGESTSTAAKHDHEIPSSATVRTVAAEERIRLATVIPRRPRVYACLCITASLFYHVLARVFEQIPPVVFGRAGWLGRRRATSSTSLERHRSCTALNLAQRPVRISLPLASLDLRAVGLAVLALGAREIRAKLPRWMWVAGSSRPSSTKTRARRTRLHAR